MSDFTRPLTVTKIIEPKEKYFLWIKYQGKKQYWIVERAFRYYVGEKDGIDFVDIPEKFKTDFASIPRIFWSVFPPDGIYTQAAVLHDYLCENPGGRSQKEIDLIFLEAMEVLNVVAWRRQSIFNAVRAFQMARSIKRGESYD